MSTVSVIDTLEQFCREHGFLYHAHGSGQWGSQSYWTYYKVEQGDTLFSIEYFPVAQRVKIRVGASRYEGQVESLPHLLELLAVMRIEVYF
jgi:hypothetical protein